MDANRNSYWVVGNTSIEFWAALRLVETVTWTGLAKFTCEGPLGDSARVMAVSRHDQ